MYTTPIETFVHFDSCPAPTYIRLNLRDGGDKVIADLKRQDSVIKMYQDASNREQSWQGNVMLARGCAVHPSYKLYRF